MTGVLSSRFGSPRFGLVAPFEAAVLTIALAAGNPDANSS
jgi:hypothetical protein